MLSAFTYVTAVSYYICLSHCMLQSIFEFQPKNRVAGWVYHVLSITAGVTYVIFAGSYQDIGKGVMLTCSMEYGGFIELLVGPLVIYASLYSLYSVTVVVREICRQKNRLPQELLTFYSGHILNVIFFNLSWIPAGIAHNLTFTFQLNQESTPIEFINYLRFMMVMVGLINSLIRIFGDPYLKWKLSQIFCKKTQLSRMLLTGSEIEDEFITDVEQRKVGGDGFSQRLSKALNKHDTFDEEVLAQIDRYQELKNSPKLNRFSNRKTLFDGESKIPLAAESKKQSTQPKSKLQVPTFVYLQEKNSVKNLKTMFTAVSFHFISLQIELESQKSIGLGLGKSKIHQRVQRHGSNKRQFIINQSIPGSTLNSFVSSSSKSPDGQSLISAALLSHKKGKMSRTMKLNDVADGVSQDGESDMKSRAENLLVEDNRETVMERRPDGDDSEDVETKIDEYNFEVFEKVRQFSGVKNEDIINSFNPEKNHRIFKKQLNEKQAGKSGKQILQTHDKRFLVKEIDSIEKEELINLSSKYSQHLQSNHNSILARIYGLFCLRIENTSKYYFIIMQNLDFFPSKSVIFRYDLKFSEVNRKHVDAMADIQIINDMLMSNDENYKEVLKQPKIDKSKGLFRAISFETSSVRMNNLIKDMEESKLSDNLLTEQNENESRTSMMKRSMDEDSVKKPKLLSSSHQYEGQLFKELRKPTFKTSNRQLLPEAIQTLTPGSVVKESYRMSADYQMMMTLPRETIKDVSNQMHGHLKLLKDQDFQNLHQVLEINREQEKELQDFFNQALSDTTFLQSQNIMDYSLLLIIAKNDSHVQNLINDRMNSSRKDMIQNSFIFYTKSKNFVIAMGLIDYLQIFNFQRNIQGKAQRFLQSFKRKPNSEISCVEPLAYHSRFNNGIQKIFKVEDDLKYAISEDAEFYDIEKTD